MLPFLIRVILRTIKKKPMPIVNAWKRTSSGRFIALPARVIGCLFLYLKFFKSFFLNCFLMSLNYFDVTMSKINFKK
jgi:hypothetical protein